MQGMEYADAVTAAMTRPRYSKGLPAIFLNGDPLRCTNSTWCDSIWTMNGHEKLVQPGSLLTVVCSKLQQPLPEACTRNAAKIALKTGNPDAGKPLEQCTNCIEVSKHRLHARGKAQQFSLSICAAIGVVACACACTFGRVFWQRSHYGGCKDSVQYGHDPDPGDTERLVE